jgi:hypothetical protein
LKEIYISVDIEAAGPVPAIYCMLSLGAAVVDDPKETFYVELKPTNDQFVPEAMKVVGKTLQDFEKSGSAPQEAMSQFQDWLARVATCDSCSLRYAIYGVFGWCPDCGVHNSLQILVKNLELARKELALAATAETDLANHLIGDALENAVSAFDGFGRELCQRKSIEIRFQNLAAARRKVHDAFGFDFADALSPDEWDAACRAFQKRHLLAHKMGVIDDDYIVKTKDPGAILGRRIALSQAEVEASIRIIESLGRRLFSGLLP